MPRPLLVAVLLTAFPTVAAAQLPPPPFEKRDGRVMPGKLAALSALSDEDALKQAGLSPTDGPKLIRYLQQRTPNQLAHTRIEDVIKQFGADGFEDRQKATEEIEAFGPAAVVPLQAASKGDDPEVAFRAKEALKRMDKVQHKAVAGAVVRALLALRPPGSAAALIGFLPGADTDALADDIRAALPKLAVTAGRPDPAVVAALADPIAVRRGAAYAALAGATPPVAVAAVRDAVTRETDPDAKFYGFWALAVSARVKDAVPGLIRVAPLVPRGRVWQIEDYLLQLAGPSPPAARFGKGDDGLAKGRDGWLAWWAGAAGRVDLAGFDYRPRVAGFTDLVQHDNRGWSNGGLACLAPDLKERWRVGGRGNPSDARVLADGRVVLVERDSNRVTKRDAAGNVIATWPMIQPVTADPLPNGGLLIGCRNEVRELDKDGNPVFTYTRQGGPHDILACRRLPGGDTVFLTTAPPGSPCHLYRLDPKGAEVGKPVPVGRLPFFAGLDVLSDKTVLLTEEKRVAEVDVATGAVGWTCPASMPSSVQRLPGGNTLIASVSVNKVVEVDPKGEVVWEYEGKDGLKVLRAYRR